MSKFKAQSQIFSNNLSALHTKYNKKGDDAHM